jgi:MFS family permease
VTDTTPRPPLFRRRPASWQRKGFRQLVIAWLFTNVADSAMFLMLAVWVKELTGSDGAAALVFVLIGAPALLAPFLGQIADRMSRKRLLTISNALMVPVLASLFMVTDPGELWLIYVVVFLYGVMAFMTAAAGSGLIRDLLPDEELASGNGLLQTIDQGLRLVSPLLGTALYVLSGPFAVVALSVISFGVTAFLLSRLEIDETPPAVPDKDAGYWDELLAGFRHLFTTPVIGALTAVLAVAFGIVGLANVAIFPFMEQGLQIQPAMLGVFVSLQGVGAVAGGITSATVVRRFAETKTVAAGCFLIAIGLLPFVGTNIPLALAGMVVLGVGVPWVVVAYTTLRQKVTPPQLQGRTTAASNVALNLPQTLATLGAAAIIGSIDYRALIWVAAVTTLICVVAVARIRTPATSV